MSGKTGVCWFNLKSLYIVEATFRRFWLYQFYICTYRWLPKWERLPRKHRCRKTEMQGRENQTDTCLTWNPNTYSLERERWEKPLEDRLAFNCYIKISKNYLKIHRLLLKEKRLIMSSENWTIHWRVLGWIWQKNRLALIPAWPGACIHRFCVHFKNKLYCNNCYFILNYFFV